MEFKANANVLTATGDKIGEVERVVIDPQTKQITHVVVRKGFLFTEDKVVPVSLIASASDEDVILRSDAGDLEALPEYVETHFVLVDERELGRPRVAGVPSAAYWYPPYVASPVVDSTESAHAEQPALVQHRRYNIPNGTVALQEGAEVVAADDEHVGDVEQVLTDPQADRVTHLVITEGLLRKHRKLVPYHWIDHILSDEIHLAVGSSCLDRLPAYQN